MSVEKQVPKRILTSLLASLEAGVVPRQGAPYIAIGRTAETEALLADLDHVADGGSSTRFIIGRYGSGKSFLMQLVRGNALDRGFLTADADLSPERKLYGSSGTGVATYRELIRNLASRSSPDGGALPKIIGNWLASVGQETVAEGILPGQPEYLQRMRAKLYAATKNLEDAVGGFDFATVAGVYYEAFLSEDEARMSAAMQWFRGEYATKTEARHALGVTVSGIIDDDNWYNYLKLIATFARIVGYKGLVVFLDECVNLYKIPNRISRENNYEKLLAMFNDTLEGRAPGLALVFAGTPQFLEDNRRGLFSYEALRSRLSDGVFAGEAYTDLIGPVIRLRRLSDNELLALVTRLTMLHAQHCPEARPVTEEEKVRFLELELRRAGANLMMTPREIIRDWLNLLNILMQNPDTTFDTLMAALAPAPDPNARPDAEMPAGDADAAVRPARVINPADIDW